MATKINIDKIWSNVKAKKQKSFSSLKKQYKKLVVDLEKLKKEKSELEKAGVEFGTPSWKTQITRDDGTRKQYLRILYPNGGRKYIGCKDEAVKKAMDDIERGQKLQKVEMAIRGTIFDIDEVIDDIKTL